jgi:crotonobetainyl-CoA:carnitine CoA-transferase CaiB-like acyl-CoA transferase
VLAALAHRDRAGEGQFIDLSSTEVMTVLTPYAFLAHAMGAGAPIRRGNGHPTMAPHGLYACTGHQRWISIAVADQAAWAGLCGLLGRPEWTTAYPDEAARRDDAPVIDEAISAWALSRTTEGAFAELQAAGVAAAPSFTNEDLMADPHLEARGTFVEITHAELGTQRLPGLPWRLSDHAWYRPTAAPDLGAHNDEVLAEWLGMGPEEIAALTDVFV